MPSTARSTSRMGLSVRAPSSIGMRSSRRTLPLSVVKSVSSTAVRST
jgi:hypothetical protein